MLNKLLDKWHATGAYRNYAVRDPNERLIILLVLGLVISSVLYLALWKPLSGWSDQAQAAHEREQTLNQLCNCFHRL